LYYMDLNALLIGIMHTTNFCWHGCCTAASLPYPSSINDIIPE
jgi:hypothetical protein